MKISVDAGLSDTGTAVAKALPLIIHGFTLAPPARYFQELMYRMYEIDFYMTGRKKHQDIKIIVKHEYREE